MKKTILSTTLILGLGAGSIMTDQTAEAAEEPVNQSELAELAQSNSDELNNAPLHEGEYNYDFDHNNVNYQFESDGTHFSWAYNGYDNVETDSEVTDEAVQSPAETPQTEAVEYESASDETVEPVQTPDNTEETAPVEESAETPQAAAPAADDGSVKEQFLDAGGSEAMWENIVMPESSGDPNAVNELGYQGLGQTKEHWGTGSVQEQTEGMLDYAEERYGSVEDAMDFRNQNNWW